MRLTPELLFQKYSVPCAHVLVEMQRIDEEKLEELKQKTYRGELIPREELESLFTAAFRRIKEVAKKIGGDHWDLEVIKKYFREEHNSYIDAGDGLYSKFPPSFCEFCKVYEAEVLSREGDLLTVSYEKGTRRVLGSLLPEAKQGDKVTIHQGFAVEKL